MTIKQLNALEQGLLRYLSQEQLKKIQSVNVGIGGAGGLGSNVAMMLVRTGFKQIEIIDHDVIEPSNLNRQQYFADEVGFPKVDVLQKRLLAINPDAQITIHRIKWAPQEAQKYFQGCDFIVEAFDQVDGKHTFVDTYHDKVKFMVSGVGMAGLTQKKSMTLRKIGNVYIAGDTQTCSHQGHPPMAPRVTQCAAMMAEVVLDLTLGINPLK
jgi:sulfur carrier protein ThiS adenylyltransferase